MVMVLMCFFFGVICCSYSGERDIMVCSIVVSEYGCMYNCCVFFKKKGL